MGQLKACGDAVPFPHRRRRRGLGGGDSESRRCGCRRRRRLRRLRRGRPFDIFAGGSTRVGQDGVTEGSSRGLLLGSMRARGLVGAGLGGVACMPICGPVVGQGVSV